MIPQVYDIHGRLVPISKQNEATEEIRQRTLLHHYFPLPPPLPLLSHFFPFLLIKSEKM